jgi:hypothetical protein
VLIIEVHLVNQRKITVQNCGKIENEIPHRSMCLTTRRSRDSGTTRPSRVYRGDTGGNRACSDELPRQKPCAARQHFDSLTWAISERNRGSILLNASMVWALLRIATVIHEKEITHITGAYDEKCDRLTRRGTTPTINQESF